MRHDHFFRRKLAHRLRVCAARQRARVGQPCDVDLNFTDLLEEIACDTELLPQALVDEVSRRCADPMFAQCFERVWIGLPDVLGTSLVPASATDLVRWMIVQAETGRERRNLEASGCSDQHGSRAVRAVRRSAPRPTDMLSSIAYDFTGAYAVVAPMLAVWEVSEAVSKWRDKVFAASHPETVANIVAVVTSEAGRGSAPVFETLAFTPPDATAVCRIAIKIGSRPPDMVGQRIAVVPRSAACQVPIIPGSIGDPWGSLLAALVAVVSGLASLKAWSWLRQRQAPSARSVNRHRSPVSRRFASAAGKCP